MYSVVRKNSSEGVLDWPRLNAKGKAAILVQEPLDSTPCGVPCMSGSAACCNGNESSLEYPSLDNKGPLLWSRSSCPPRPLVCPAPDKVHKAGQYEVTTELHGRNANNASCSEFIHFLCHIVGIVGYLAQTD